MPDWYFQWSINVLTWWHEHPLIWFGVLVIGAIIWLSVILQDRQRWRGRHR